MQSCFLCFDICLLKTHKKSTRRSIRSYRRYTQLIITTSNYIVSYQASLPTEQKLKGRGDNAVVGTVVKAKICELEEEVRAGNSRRMSKDLTGVDQGICGEKRLLARFQDGCKNDITSYQLTIVTV